MIRHSAVAVGWRFGELQYDQRFEATNSWADAEETTQAGLLVEEPVSY